MEPTNRPITSREYKLLLNTERFRDRPDGTGLFWKLVEFLVKNQGNEVIPDAQDPDKNEEKKRTTWYLDTPGFELRRNNVTVRMRDREGSKYSFGFDADGQGDENQLEKFPPTVVAGANRLFRDLQNQAGWLAQFGTTKTAYVFDVM